MSLTRFPRLTSCAVAAALAIAGVSGAQQNDQNNNSQQNDSTNNQSDRADFNRDQRANDGTDRYDSTSRQNDRYSDQNNDRGDNQQQRDQQQRENQNQNQNQNQSDRNAGLGVTVFDTDRGVRVSRVMQGSPAEEAGIQQNDQILSVGGEDFRSAEQLVRMVQQKDPGEQVRIELLRDGQRKTVQVKLETREEALNRSQRNYRGGQSPPWGSDDLREHVQQLDRQVQMLQRELRELRGMMDDDPSRRDFTTNNQRFNQPNRAQSSNTGTTTNRAPRYVDSGNYQNNSGIDNYNDDRNLSPNDAAGRANWDERRGGGFNQ